MEADSHDTKPNQVIQFAHERKLTILPQLQVISQSDWLIYRGK